MLGIFVKSIQADGDLFEACVMVFLSVLHDVLG